MPSVSSGGEAGEAGAAEKADELSNRQVHEEMLKKNVKFCLKEPVQPKPNPFRAM